MPEAEQCEKLNQTTGDSYTRRTTCACASALARSQMRSFGTGAPGGGVECARFHCQRPTKGLLSAHAELVANRAQRPMTTVIPSSRVIASSWHVAMGGSVAAIAMHWHSSAFTLCFSCALDDRAGLQNSSFHPRREPGQPRDLLRPAAYRPIHPGPRWQVTESSANGARTIAAHSRAAPHHGPTVGARCE